MGKAVPAGRRRAALCKVHGEAALVVQVAWLQLPLSLLGESSLGHTLKVSPVTFLSIGRGQKPRRG